MSINRNAAYNTSRFMMFIILLIIAFTSFIEPAEYSGFCNKVTKRFGDAWELQTTRGWVDLVVSTLEVDSPSDLVVKCAVWFSEGNPGGARVEYRILVGDSRTGTTFTRRVPQQAPDTQEIMEIFPDLEPGRHVVRFQANNLSPANVYFKQFWINPMLVDSDDNLTAMQSNEDTVYVGSPWTTIDSVTVPVASDRMLEIGSSFTVVSGSPGTKLQYRLRDGLLQLFLWEDSTPAEMPDEVHLSRFYRPAVPVRNLGGPLIVDRTIELQVRNATGATTQIASSRIVAQTMPRYELFNAGSANIPEKAYTNYWQTILETSEDYISPASLGEYGSYVAGNAFVVLPPQAGAAPWRLGIYLSHNDTLYPFDIGFAWAQPGLSIKLASDSAEGCESCGFATEEEHKALLRVKGLCSGSTLQIARATVQVIMVPNNHEVTNLCELGSTMHAEGGHNAFECP